MDITHEELVRALVKPPLDILNSLSQDSVDLWHGATGVAGEVGELVECLAATDDPMSADYNIDNLIEELGDLFFYLEQLRQRIGKPWRDSSQVAEQNNLDMQYLPKYLTAIVVTGCNILDMVKKAAVYNKLLNPEDLDDHIYRMDLLLETIMAMFGLPRAAVLGANIDKLRKRYGERYSDVAAQERADKQERKFIGKTRMELNKK